MDKVCSVGYLTNNEIKDYIEKNCERNMILTATVMNNAYKTSYFIARWCRYDRNVNQVKDDDIGTIYISCVLYSKKPRVYVRT